MVALASESFKSLGGLLPFSTEIFTPDSPGVEVWDKSKTANWLNLVHFNGEEIGLCLRRGKACFTVATTLDQISGCNSFTFKLDFDQLERSGFSVNGMWGQAGRNLVYVPGQVKIADRSRPEVVFDETSQVLARRKALRQTATPVDVEIRQDDNAIGGSVADVAGAVMKIRLSGGASAHIIDAARPSSVRFFQNGRLLLETDATVMRYSPYSSNLVVALSNLAQPRFVERKCRNPRLVLNPGATLRFTNPFTGRQSSADIEKLSSNGLSLLTADDAGIVPGLRLYDMSLHVDGSNLKFSGVIVHSGPSDDGRLRCGVYINDMPLEVFVKMSAVAARAQDARVQVGGRIDQRELWRFMFESGFIYSSKYQLLAAQALELKRVFAKLYSGTTSVFQSITYQNSGVIHGHVSMVKAYAGVWMVQHLAALPIAGRKTGIAVLHQILNYLDGLFRVTAGDMRYMMFFYRPENSFPEHFFGGTARAIDDRQRCALDEFGYGAVAAADVELPEPWRLAIAGEAELDRVARYYAGRADLMWQTMGLSRADDRSLAEEYQKFGLRRGFARVGLYHGDDLKALVVIDQAEQGINLSELLNCPKVFVLDESLPTEIMRTTLSLVARSYVQSEVPVLIHPLSYAADLGVKKRYTLFSVDGRHGDLFCETLKQLAKYSGD